MLAIFYYVILLSYVLRVLSVTIVDVLPFIHLMIALAYSISNNGASHLNTRGYTK